MKRRILISLLLIFSASCDALEFADKASPRTVDYRDRTHLTLLGGLVMGHAQKTGMVPENIVDAHSKPLLSWRVMVLQYGGDEEVRLFKQFKLDEPWDSEHNKKVAENIPEYYVDQAGSKYTPYLGVSGKNAAFSVKPRPIDGIRESNNSIHAVGNTHAAIVTVDTNKVKVFWTEPKDAPLEKVKNGECLRWYKNQATYLDTSGCPRQWVKDGKYPFDKAVFEFDEGS